MLVNLLHPGKPYVVNTSKKPFQQEHLDFIRSNASTHTMCEMAKILGFHPVTLFKYAKHFGIKSKVNKRSTDPNLVALVINEFANSNNLMGASKKGGVSYVTASKMVSAHFFYKPLSESTEIVTKQSKV